MPLKNNQTTTSLANILVGSVIPPGTIQAFGGGSVPAGWLLCDGATVSRATFSALFEAVGTAHGAGDGSTTFHLPDMRGRFLRGADNMGTGAAGRDPNAGTRTAGNAGGATGNTVGSVQDSAFGQHNHAFFNNGSASMAAVSSGGGDPLYKTININQNTATNSTGIANAGGSTESRPQNLAVEYIIKV